MAEFPDHIGRKVIAFLIVMSNLEVRHNANDQVQMPMLKGLTFMNGNVSILDGEIVASKGAVCQKPNMLVKINVLNYATKILSVKPSL
jgi:hypothetical protein